MTVVTFTTDFGTADGYVGAMKGVVLSLAADAVLVDITHEIARHDVAAGAFALAQAASLYPTGTVHVAVVDPGVGGRRKELLVEAGGALYLGPDNGLLSLATRGARQGRVIRSIEAPHFRRPSVSPTFHGRDVFAQAAGRLAAGAPPQEAGPVLAQMADLDSAPASSASGRSEAAVIMHIDAFGNLITSWAAEALPASRFFIQPDGGQPFEVTSGRTYSDVASGELMAYVGSAGFIELAVRDGSAAGRTGLARGDRLWLGRAS
jgi:S-adenosyl-L-methionine hydrolase (adenosine-forming)